MFRRAINCNKSHLPNEPQFGALLKNIKRTLVELICNIFPDLNNHVFGDTVEELSNHTHSSNLLL